MKKPTIYLETSFINRLADPPSSVARDRQEQLDSRAWWTTLRRRYTLVTSDLTIGEACEHYDNKRIVRLRQRYLTSAAVIHVPTSLIDPLSHKLLSPYGPIPARKLIDAQHLAVAAIFGCKKLLTWNYRHLINPNHREILDTIIRRHGYTTPVILTPYEDLQAALG